MGNVKRADRIKFLKVSHMRRRSDLFKLNRLLSQESKNKFAIGDEISNLVENKGWLITELACHFKLKRNRLSEIRHTAKAFGPNMRDYSIPFSRYELARIGVAKFKHAPKGALKLVMKKGLNQRRDAMRFFAAIDRDRRNRKSAATACLRNSSSNRILNRCHHIDCRIIARKLEDKSVKIAFVDASYGRYGNYKDGRHNQDGASSNNCDNATTAQVIELIDDLMQILIKKLAKGGVMLLCRPGGIIDPLFDEITRAAAKYGWEIPKILTWDKGRVQIGDRQSPYSFDTETIWVLKRQGEQLENHDGSSTKTVLRFPPVTQRSITALQSHLFIKPLELCKFLIRKHSFEGELVFDVCGCSGNFSISALELNRQFIYAESNQQNYELGSRRVYKTMKLQRPKVG
jgi:DNA modification methylase